MKKLARTTVTVIFMIVMIITSISVEAKEASTNNFVNHYQVSYEAVNTEIFIESLPDGSYENNSNIVTVDEDENMMILPVEAGSIYFETYYEDYPFLTLADCKTIQSVNLDVDFQKYVYQTAISYGLNPYVVFGLIERESTYRFDAVNGSHKGLMQITAKYQKERMAELGCTDLYDPYQNVLVGCSYLAELLANSNGNYELALMYYNEGNKAKGKYSRKGASSYAKYILRRADEMAVEISQYFYAYEMSAEGSDL